MINSYRTKYKINKRIPPVVLTLSVYLKLAGVFMIILKMGKLTTILLGSGMHVITSLFLGVVPSMYNDL